MLIGRSGGLSGFAGKKYSMSTALFPAEILLPLRRQIHAHYSFRFWQLVTDSMPPQDALTLAEDLGIEQDTNEHLAVERGPLGTTQKNLKRKR